MKKYFILLACCLTFTLMQAQTTQQIATVYYNGGTMTFHNNPQCPNFPKRYKMKSNYENDMRKWISRRGFHACNTCTSPTSEFYISWLTPAQTVTNSEVDTESDPIVYSTTATEVGSPVVMATPTSSVYKEKEFINKAGHYLKGSANCQIATIGLSVGAGVLYGVGASSGSKACISVGSILAFGGFVTECMAIAKKRKAGKCLLKVNVGATGAGFSCQF